MSANRQCKVYSLDKQYLLRMMRGEIRIKNLPGDAHVIAACTVGESGIGLRVHSVQFDPVPPFKQLPVVVAIFEKTPEAA